MTRHAAIRYALLDQLCLGNDNAMVHHFVGWCYSSPKLETTFKVDGLGLDPGSDWPIVGVTIAFNQCAIVFNSSPATIDADFCECDNRDFF